MNNKRNSAIELFKTIGMVLICIHHFNYSNMVEGVFSNPKNIYQFCHIFYTYFGPLGNSIFAISSAYFLVKDHNIKLYKIVRIILIQTIITSSIALYYNFYISKLPLAEILSSVLPTLTKQHWFITAYILYYVLHKPLNLMLEQYNGQQIRVSLILLYFFYFVCKIWRRVDIPMSNITEFVIIHITVYYLLNYASEFMNNYVLNKKILFYSIFMYISSILICVIVNHYIGMDFVF